MTAAGYVFELQGIIETLKRELARVEAVAAEAAGWHRPGTGGQGGRSRRVCTECAFPWPCRTYERLTEKNPI